MNGTYYKSDRRGADDYARGPVKKLDKYNNESDERKSSRTTPAPRLDTYHVDRDLTPDMENPSLINCSNSTTPPNSNSRRSSQSGTPRRYRGSSRENLPKSSKNSPRSLNSRSNSPRAPRPSTSASSRSSRRDAPYSPQPSDVDRPTMPDDFRGARRQHKRQATWSHNDSDYAKRSSDPRFNKEDNYIPRHSAPNEKHPRMPDRRPTQYDNPRSSRSQESTREDSLGSPVPDPSSVPITRSHSEREARGKFFGYDEIKSEEPNLGSYPTANPRSMISATSESHRRIAEISRSAVSVDRGQRRRKKDRKEIKMCHILKDTRGYSEKFLLPPRYEADKIIGKGTYASVIQAKDCKHDRVVAIKKNRKVFANTTDAKRVLRELQILSRIWHPDIIELNGVIAPEFDEIDKFDDVYLIMPKMEANLSEVIQISQLTPEHIQFFMYQLLRGIKYLHSAGVIHRDLKPDNIFVNGQDCDVRIGDFGLARGVRQKPDDTQLTEYVVTRWYRAPQIICGADAYGGEVDVWSLGCILAEMLIRTPLFKGHSNSDQIKCIFKVLGTPSEKQSKWIRNPKINNWINRSKREKGSFDQLFEEFDDDVVDLLRGLLNFDPAKRLTVTQALDHEYFSDIREPGSEYDAPSFIFENIKRNARKPEAQSAEERITNTLFGCRHLIFQELKGFRKTRKRARQIAMASIEASASPS